MDSQLELIESAIGTIIAADTTTTNNLSTVVDAYRILRNSVASDEKFARFIFEDERNLIKKASTVFKNLTDTIDDESRLVLKRCVLQFIGNLVSRVQQAKLLVFDEFQTVLVDLLSHDDAKIRSYASMVLFNCLDRASIDKFCSSNDDESVKLLKKIYERVKTDDVDVEWHLFIIESFLIDGESFFRSFWTLLSTDDQIFTIEICLSMLEKSEKRYPHASNVNYLVNVFVQLSELLVPIDVDGESSKFDETQFCCLSPLFSPILNVFCKVTGDSQGVTFDQIRLGDQLLESSLKLLTRIQRLCHDGHSFFAIGKIAQSFSDGADHPASGLKRDLVNLTANLCYRSVERQYLARQMDAVPLILDCTMMDARNHFITQWAILALRNLLEDCPENQRVVAMLNPESLVENSELLKELRLEPYLDERGRVKLKIKSP